MSPDLEAELLDLEAYEWPGAVRDRIVRLERDEYWIDDEPWHRVIVVLKGTKPVPSTITPGFGRVSLAFVDAFDEAGVEGPVGLVYLTEADRKRTRPSYARA